MSASIAGRACPALRPLAAAFAALLATTVADSAAASPPPAPRAIVVTNCADSGSGSLRDAVSNAADGDTIDLTQLGCGVISLSTGAIVMGASDLTLHGPGAHALTIMGVGGSGDGVLYDLGGGTLTVDGVDVAFGSKYRSDVNARGGCIYSNGNVTVSDAHVYACTTRSHAAYDSLGGAIFAAGNAIVSDSQIDLCGVTVEDGIGKGGGIYAGGDLTLMNSRVSGCRVATATRGLGGGIYAGGDFVAKYSTISDNTVDHDDGTLSLGGGIYTLGDAHLYWSTLSGNSAGSGGGAFMTGGNNGHTAVISESTISGNEAHAAGGVRADLPLRLYNSTIAFNRIPRPTSQPIGYSTSAGLGVTATPVLIESSIIANNVAYGVVDELADLGGDIPATAAGGNDLIMSSALTPPPDTIDDDPQLRPLADNGGPTATHALPTGSPAIDHGNNVGAFSTDQRGSGFVRVLGSGPDIGAYESDPDRIFFDGFE